MSGTGSEPGEPTAPASAGSVEGAATETHVEPDADSAGQTQSGEPAGVQTSPHAGPGQEPPLRPEAAFALEVTRRQWRPLALVLSLAVVGVVLVVINFRLGALTLAAAVGTALLIRASLSEEDAGLLAVRAKYLDVIALALLAAGLLVLGLWVPTI